MIKTIYKTRLLEQKSTIVGTCRAIAFAGVNDSPAIYQRSLLLLHGRALFLCPPTIPFDLDAFRSLVFAVEVVREKIIVTHFALSILIRNLLIYVSWVFYIFGSNSTKTNNITCILTVIVNFCSKSLVLKIVFINEVLKSAIAKNKISC